MKTIDLVYLGEGVKGVKGCFGFFFLELANSTTEIKHT